MYMRTLTVLILAFSLLFSPSAALAFLNDSEIIEIGQAPPPELPPENAVQTGSGTTDTSDTGSTSGGGTSASRDETTVVFSDTGGTNNSSVVTEVSVTSTDSGSSASSGGATTSGDSTNTTDTVSTDEIITVLIGSQAVVTTSGTSGGGGTFFSSGGIRIFAGRVRDALRAQHIAGLSIPNARDVLSTRASNGRGLSRNDFTLFVTSAILKDENMQDIHWNQGVLTTEYRVLGRLFGFIPHRYTLFVSLEVLPGSEAEARVNFPWYRFFLATGTSRSTLEAAIETAVKDELGDHEAEFDVATRAFTVVADVLSVRAGL